jgi:indole-3-glycerol phosphate synthase
MDKLAEIMAHKRREIAPLIRPVFEEELARANGARPAVPSFARALKRPDGKLAVIAEIKRRSPSAGTIKELGSAVEQAGRYLTARASALSILTDERYFGGRLADLEEVTTHFQTVVPALPCLRKDFMVHPVQVLQACQAGASAILIIVRALDDAEIAQLHRSATAAGMDALYEIHDERDLERSVAHGAAIIGVNNRDLAVFKCDLGLSERLIPQIPRDVIAVSESGIFNGRDAARVRAAGAQAILVGEALMKAEDPAVLIKEFNVA